MIPKHRRRRIVQPIRLTESERAHIQEEAKQAGQSVSDWIRERILGTSTAAKSGQE